MLQLFLAYPLAPGSRVVTDYLAEAGLDEALNALGFELVAYGCTTCIGNSGPLDAKIEEAIKTHDIVAVSVLSGNRNFEARIHSAVRANFLMSPPLVVAFAIAGRIDIDMETEPLGFDRLGKPVFLKEIWPTGEEIADAMRRGVKSAMFRERYTKNLEPPLWKSIAVQGSARFPWNSQSTYIRHPPYFASFSKTIPERKTLAAMRALALLGDSVTTDHISPAGAFTKSSPAGQYLCERGVAEKDFNSYGSRRGNHEVMMRGTLANVRIRNAMAEGKEGGFTKLMPEGIVMSIFEACREYEKRQTCLILFAGKDYGMGSSRDWAAKGVYLLGVRAVAAQNFERIHRSNLIGMGVLPLLFREGEGWESLGIDGTETFSIACENIRPRATARLETSRGTAIELTLAIETPMEAEYYLHGGIMPYVLRQIISG